MLVEDVISDILGRVDSDCHGWVGFDGDLHCRILLEEFLNIKGLVRSVTSSPFGLFTTVAFVVSIVAAIWQWWRNL